MKGITSLVYLLNFWTSISPLDIPESLEVFIAFTNTFASPSISTGNFASSSKVGIFGTRVSEYFNHADSTKYDSLIEGILNKICLISVYLLGQNLENLDSSALLSFSRIV
jgi:hypothetical protein